MQKPWGEVKMPFQKMNEMKTVTLTQASGGVEAEKVHRGQVLYDARGDVKMFGSWEPLKTL